MSSSRLRTGFRHVPRVLLGLIFFVFGLNGFLHFIPQPPPTGQALAFVSGVGATGYFFPLLKGTEVLAGLVLLANRFVPLALTVLAPIVINILAFHLFLAPSGVGLAVLLVALELVLAWFHRETFAPMLKAKAKTSAGVAASLASASTVSAGLSTTGSHASSRA